MISTAKLLLEYNFAGLSLFFVKFAKIYSLIIFGYGLWVLFGLLVLYYRLSREKDKIPFSQFWWAFIFPVAAFTLATINIYAFIVKLWFFKISAYILYFGVLFLWFYVLIKQGKEYFKKH